MPVKIKSMSVPVPSKAYWRTNTLFPASTGPWNLEAQQGFQGHYTITSEDTLIGKNNPGPPYKSGGVVFIKHERTFKQHANVRGMTNSLEYKGPMYISALPPQVTIADFSTELWAQGSTGIARARPGNASASLSNFLFELRELPQLLRTRKASSGYLGYEFGVKPLISDLRKLYQTWSNLDTQLNQLRRDNGKWIRREVDLAEDKKVTKSSSTGVFLFPTRLVPASHVRNYTLTETYRFWFSGRFRYFIPDLGPNRWPASTIRKLYGLDINPEVVWNAIPWTWLFDWFGNAGDVMSNLSANAADDLVMDYGYVMGTKKTVGEYSVSCPIYGMDRKVSSNVHLRNGRSLEIKQRAVASPYSFGASPGTLSSRQLAILAALGLTKSGSRF